MMYRNWSVVVGAVLAVALSLLGQGTAISIVDDTLGVLLPNPPTCTRPVNFPANITLAQRDYQNKDTTITVKNLWTAIAETSEDVVTLANWASANNYTLLHNAGNKIMSPISISLDTNCNSSIMVDIAELNETKVFPDGTADKPYPHIWAETGIFLIKILEILEVNNLGVAVSPPCGDVTFGSVLSIGGRGFVVPLSNPDIPVHHSYGTVNNLVVEVSAVVWSEVELKYTLQTFARSNPIAAALLGSINSVLVVSAILRVEPNYNLRCISTTDIPTTDLFADPNLSGSSGRTVGSLVEQTGRVAVVHFPYTEGAWIINCSYSPDKPAESRQVDTPYNYPLNNNFTSIVNGVVSNGTANGGVFTPAVSLTQFLALSAALTLSQSRDLWGKSKNLLLYIEAGNLPVTVLGYAVLTRRQDIQRVVHMIMKHYNELQEEYKSGILDNYPVNEPLGIIITGIDDPVYVGVSGAKAPYIGVNTPVTAHPEYDATVWFESSNAPNTPLNLEFHEKMETFLLDTFDGEVLGLARPDWLKSWGYDILGRWRNTNMLFNKIPSRFENWNLFICFLNKLDPKRVYRNEFLKSLLVSFGAPAAC